MKMIDLNENDLETLEVMHSLLIKHKDIFYNWQMGLCMFFMDLFDDDLIGIELYRNIIALIDFITAINEEKEEIEYWFTKGNYELRKKYLEDLIIHNKKIINLIKKGN